MEGERKGGWEREEGGRDGMRETMGQGRGGGRSERSHLNKLENIIVEFIQTQKLKK